MPRGWAACKCFYRRNFYVKQLDEHLEYLGDEQFLFQYQKYFNKCDGRTILEDVKTELARRKNRFTECEENRKNILERFQLSLEIKSAAVTNIIERSQPTEIIDNIFRLPVFEPSFCDQIMEETGKKDFILNFSFLLTLWSCCYRAVQVLRAAALAREQHEQARRARHGDRAGHPGGPDPARRGDPRQV